VGVKKNPYGMKIMHRVVAILIFLFKIDVVRGSCDRLSSEPVFFPYDY